MTDRRYQDNINSLVYEKKRRRIGPPKDRGPVEGGRGYAVKTIEEVSTLNVFFPRTQGVVSIGPSPLVDPVIVYANLTDPIFAIPIGEDMFTTQGASIIWKNGVELVGSGYTNIICITGNSTGLLIVDAGADSTAIPKLYWLDLDTGAVTSSLLSGEPWQVGASIPSSEPSIRANAVISANETHFCLPCFGDGSPGVGQGYFLYENDFTFVARIMFDHQIVLGYQGQCQLTENHLYVMDSGDSLSPVQDGFRLSVYDLDGNLLDTQDIGLDASLDDYRNFEVTDRELYMKYDTGTGSNLLVVPRETGEVTFDFSDPEIYEYPSSGGSGFLTVNRDFAVDY